MNSGEVSDAPVANLAFAPGPQTTGAPEFVGAITVAQTPMQAAPAVERPMQDGRDARLFPGVTLEFFTMTGRAIHRQNTRLIAEAGATVSDADFSRRGFLRVAGQSLGIAWISLNWPDIAAAAHDAHAAAASPAERRRGRR